MLGEALTPRPPPEARNPMHDSGPDFTPRNQDFLVRPPPPSKAHMDAFEETTAYSAKSQGCETCRRTEQYHDSNPSFKALLRSNEAPLPSQYLWLEEQKAQAEEDIVLLNVKLRHLTTYLYKCKTILNPIRRLPTEILTSIFSLTKDEAFDIKDRWTTDHGCVVKPCSGARKPPWYLAQVCRRWRAAALSFPSLWTGFVFDLKDTTLISRLRMQTALLRQTEYVRDQLISLTISPYGLLVMALPIFETLTALSTSWKSLRVSAATNYKLFDSVKGAVPHLCELHISTPAVFPSGDSASNSASPQYDAFEIAPALRKVVFSGDPLFVLEEMKLPWDQLTDFTWRSESDPPDIHFLHRVATNGTHIQLLSRMFNLVSCELDDLREDAEIAFEPETSLVLSSLTTLVLNATGDDIENRGLMSNCAQLLNAIDTPSLQHLTIRGWLSYDEITCAQNFILRSDCALQSLHIGVDSDSEDAVLGLLWALPSSVLKLSLQFQDHETLISSVIFALCPLPERPTLLPRLESLHLAGVFLFPEDAFLDMLESRFAAGESVTDADADGGRLASGFMEAQSQTQLLRELTWTVDWIASLEPSDENEELLSPTSLMCNTRALDFQKRGLKMTVVLDDELNKR